MASSAWKGTKTKFVDSDDDAKKSVETVNTKLSAAEVVVYVNDSDDSDAEVSGDAEVMASGSIETTRKQADRAKYNECRRKQVEEEKAAEQKLLGTKKPRKKNDNWRSGAYTPAANSIKSQKAVRLGQTVSAKKGNDEDDEVDEVDEDDEVDEEYMKPSQPKKAKVVKGQVDQVNTEPEKKLVKVKKAKKDDSKKPSQPKKAKGKGLPVLTKTKKKVKFETPKDDTEPDSESEETSQFRVAKKVNAETPKDGDETEPDSDLEETSKFRLDKTDEDHENMKKLAFDCW
jgi:hypothetical protein